MPFDRLELRRTASPVSVPASGITIETSSALVLVQVVAVEPGATFMPQNWPSAGVSESVCSVMTLSCGRLPPLAVSVVTARQLGAWADDEFTTRRFKRSAAVKSIASAVSAQLVAPPLTAQAKVVLAPFFRSVTVWVPEVIAPVQFTNKLLTRPALGSTKLVCASFDTA